MSLVLADRVRETTQTTGTGTITLDGAVQGFQSFAVIGNNNTTYYTINRGSEWEVGIGTYYGGTLSRDTVYASSNGGSKVNFSAGAKDVFVTYPAGKSVNEDANNRVLIPYTTGTTNVGSLNVGDATAHTDSGVIAGFTASEPLYLYTSLQNTSTTNTSYASYAVNDGLHTAYAELGINNSTYSYSAAGYPNNGFSTPLASFVESYGGPLVIGSWDNQKISMIINGAVSTTDAMTINTNGSVAFNGQVGTAGQLLQSNATSAPTWVTPNAGTVTSVSGTGTVSGISLSGTVTSSGNLTLGGTLDLSSPPTIGNTTPNTGSFTTLIGGGGSANYGQLTGGATTKAVEFKTIGSDTNVGLAIRSQGTGAIDLAAGSSGVNISNGGTVTAITRTASGGGSYTTVPPTITFTDPTTSGGTRATATCTLVISTATVVSGGSGYAVGDTLNLNGGSYTTQVLLTVATLSGSAIATVTLTTGGSYTSVPTGTISTTTATGSGSGATFTATWGVSNFVITNAGSGYVEQPTITFSSGSATAYATVGSATTVKSIGQTINFYTANAGIGLAIVDLQASNTPAYLQLQGNALTSINYAQGGSGANSNIAWVTKGTGTHQFYTNTSTSTLQFNIAHTASAVNYVQVTGAATGGTVTVSAQGSDGSVGMRYVTKGNFNHQFQNGSFQIGFEVAPSASTANYIRATSSAATVAPILSAQGTDTDIDLALTPKNAGAVRFGTYTASALLAVAGYITIKDSGGTSRRLLVG